MNWKPVGVVVEGHSFLVSDLNVWDYEWVRLKEPSITLAHPSYPAQLHGFHLYQIEHGAHKAKFAAAELSPSVFGFYEAISYQRESLRLLGVPAQELNHKIVDLVAQDAVELERPRR